MRRYCGDSPSMTRGKTLDAETFYLSAEEIVALHNALLGAADVDPEGVVRDWNLLESAVARPRMAAYYEEADLLRQATTLFWGWWRITRSMMEISVPAGWRCGRFSSSTVVF